MSQTSGKAILSLPSHQNYLLLPSNDDIVFCGASKISKPLMVFLLFPSSSSSIVITLAVHHCHVFFFNSPFMKTLDHFFHEKENMTTMMRDNASNAIKACHYGGIPHFGCIGHICI